MITVAITGRSGVGKSTVTARFIEAGIPVVDADQVARDVLAPGSACLPQLQAIFGNGICKGEILDRRVLADRAFATPAGTKALTEITHPEILRRILAKKQAAEQANAPLFAIDGAVIIGTPCEDICDCFVVVTAPFAQSVARIAARDSIAPAMAERRLNAQLPEETLRKRADYLIQNNADKELLLRRTDETILHLRRDADATKAPL